MAIAVDNLETRIVPSEDEKAIPLTEGWLRGYSALEKLLPGRPPSLDDFKEQLKRETDPHQSNLIIEGINRQLYEINRHRWANHLS